MAMLLRILVLASLSYLGLGVVLFGLRVRSNPFGDPPIGRLQYLTAKLAMTASVVLLGAAAIVDAPRLPPAFSAAVFCLLVGGSAIFTLSMQSLGANLRMGLPQEETSLVIGGIYRFSRNPIYVALYLFMAASLIYAFSWVNVIAVSLTVALHHRIVLAEERFLAARFREYDAYRHRVRRYL